MEWQALQVSFRLALWTSSLLLLTGPPLAFWLTQSGTKAKRLIEALLTLPLFLPPTVLGFFLLTWMGPQGWMGRVAQILTGEPLAFRFPGLVLASCVYSLPFGVLPIVAAFRGIEPTYWETSRTLGAGPWETFFRVILPLGWPGVVSSAVLTFAHTMGEFGVALMVGGNLPGSTRTLSIALYDRVEMLDMEAARRISYGLLAVSTLFLWLVLWLEERFPGPRSAEARR
jgi:molybdate transport system permease protein